MQIAPITRFLTTLWLLSAAQAHAVAKPKPLPEAAGEVITWIESVDPSTQKDKEAWDKVRKAIATAGEQAESEAGLKLSVTRILEHWNGKAFRVLDEADLQQWALLRSDQPYPDSGAIFQARGPQWTVQFIGNRGQRLFRRGDQVKTPGFHPIHSAVKNAKIDIEVQSSSLSPVRKLQLGFYPQRFADYVLAETQAAGTTVSSDNKRVCLQKAWFWMNEAVNAHLLSKIQFQNENCAAQLIDLRDSFGQEPTAALDLKKKIPTVVLINNGTREGAARLAARLKKDWGARIIGETSGQPLLPEKQLTLKALPWTLVSYAGQVAPLEPDEAVKDSLVFAEGLDAVKEQGLIWIGAQLKK